MPAATIAATPPNRAVSEKQGEFVTALRSRRYRYMLFGGGTGGGKSYLGAQIFINLAVTQPGTSYGVFRKNRPTLIRTTIRTFFKYLKNNHFKEGRDYVWNKSELTLTFVKSGSTIDFMELDISKDPEMNKLGGLELTAAMIDEADEVAEQAFNTLRFRIGRNNYHGEKAFIYLTCNPNQSWVKRLFYDPHRRGKLEPPFYFLESLITDNPYQPPEALDAVNDPSAPQQYVLRYFKGDWDYIEVTNAIIQLKEFEHSWIETVPPVASKWAGVDPSREGKDNPTMAVWEGNVLKQLYVLTKPAASDVAEYGKVLGDQVIAICTREGIPASQVAVDGVGNGAEIIGYLRGQKFFVRTFKSGMVEGIEMFPAEAGGGKKYDNIRSENYWKMGRALANRTARVYEHIDNREELQKDLLAHTYRTNEKMTIVDSKELVKKLLLGRSPDFSDAAVMGWWVKTLPAEGGTVLVGGSYKKLYNNGRR